MTTMMTPALQQEQQQAVHLLRTAASFMIPPGKLGVLIAPSNVNTNGHVYVAGVDPDSSLFGKLQPGDWIAQVNEHSVHQKDVTVVCGILKQSEQNPCRFLTVLRVIIPTTTTIPNPYNAIVAAKMAAQSKPAPAGAKRPPPPVGNHAAALGPPPKKKLATTTTTTCHKKPAPFGNHDANQKKMATTTTTMTKKPAPVQKQKKKKKTTTPFLDHHDIPEPGFVDTHGRFYSTCNNETLAGVAEKLGTDWNTLRKLNIPRYGTDLKANSIFKPYTLLQIPEIRSTWKMKQLQVDHSHDPAETCIECGSAQNNKNLLLCDGCDVACHTTCVGLTKVPDGDWFCKSCLVILEARQPQPPAAAPHSQAQSQKGHPHQLPSLPPLETTPEQTRRFEDLGDKLQLLLKNRRRRDLRDLAENYEATRDSHRTHEGELQEEIANLRREEQSAAAKYSQHFREKMNDLDLVAWAALGGENGWIQLRQGNEEVTLQQQEEVVSERRIPRYPYWDRKMSSQWKNAYRNVQRVSSDPTVQRWKKTKDETEKRLADSKMALQDAQAQAKQVNGMEQHETHKIQMEYAALLQEPRHAGETKTAYAGREPAPRYLGQVTLKNDGNVVAINMLQEPEELILVVPTHFVDYGFDPICLNRTYAVYCRVAFFDKKRDDALPMGQNGVRDAQRHLFQLLMANDANQAMVVTRPSLPPSVRIRVRDNDNSARCFDLGELVRDCNVDLDLPREPTPTRLATKGLELRDYQQSSLRWILDKEKETTGLGLAGELWHRLRFLEQANDDFFYCELTGSFALDIFEYRDDVEQKDASINRFSMPTGGVLGEEMGLGKTVCAIAVIEANPPPLHRRVLPREHIWVKERKTSVDHPAYVPLPSVGNLCLSNGTLIIVPMTLLSQWQTEIERFAPHFTVTALHKEETPTLEDIATSDIVIASTALLQKVEGVAKRGKGKKDLLGFLKRIHWHRVIVDEAHYNHHGEKTKTVIAKLSTTHRLAVTGTPIGSQLSDLYGQLRFLRLAPFDRPNFWKNNVEDPYFEHNTDGLHVLRSLLSRIVIRHSKEQTFANGKALLALPPRSVETVLLEFGSEAERAVYDGIETRNRNHFMKLRQESTAKVASKFIELNGLLTSSRQACAHASLISLEKLDHFNNRTSDWKKSHLPASSGKKTRNDILKDALSKARKSATARMRVVINQFQHGLDELMECPVCLECVGESDIAVPACAHAVCSQCIVSLLDDGASSSTREACGHCPTCRDIMRRSEITFLGEAADAGKSDKSVGDAGGDQDSKEAAVISTNGFQMTAKDVRMSVAGASTIRFGKSKMTDVERRSALHKDRALLSTLKEDFLSKFYDCEDMVGTKIAELLQEINSMIQKDKKSKCVVFSQFLGVLDVAAEELTASGIAFVRIDGNCKQHERADALIEFSSNPDIKVFLLSMRAGSVGLTLTAADHCFIMDIAQNSAIEEQAIDRIHRIGQTRPVTVKRFVMQGTVEERLLGVRRSLGVDRPATGTQLCGASVLASEEMAARRVASNGGGSEDVDNARRQQRVAMLENMFGLSGNMTVHKT